MSIELITNQEDIKNKLDVFIQSATLQDMFKEQKRLAVIKMAGYGKALVMPYEQAVEFIKTLHRAEEVDVSYGNKITFPKQSELLDVTFKVIDEKRYNRAKVAYHLGIDGDALDTYLNGTMPEEEELPF